MTLVVAAAGCGDSSADKAGSRTTKVTQPLTNTKPTAPPTTTRDQLKEQILADYKKANDAYYDAFSSGNPKLPSLAETHTGTNLSTIQTNLTALSARGVVAKEGSHSRTTDRAVVLQLLDQKAVLQDCVIDDGAQVELATGKVIDDRVITRTSRVELELDNGRWKVKTATTLREWEGVAGCAVGSS